MDFPTDKLLLKRAVNIRVIVTPAWKEEVTKQIQDQLGQVDGQLQQLELQGQRAIAELQSQNLLTDNPQLRQQIESIQGQVNQQRSELLDQKNQLLQQLQQVQLFEMEQEVIQGQMDSLFTLGVGDNIINKLNTEIVIRDGVVQEIRGEL